MCVCVSEEIFPELHFNSESSKPFALLRRQKEVRTLYFSHYNMYNEQQLPVLLILKARFRLAWAVAPDRGSGNSKEPPTKCQPYNGEKL